MRTVVKDKKGTAATKKIAAFRFLRSYLEQHDITTKEVALAHEEEVSSVRMSIASVSKMAGVPPQTFRIAISHMFRRIGEVAKTKEPVEIDFSVGVLVSDRGLLEFRLSDAEEKQAPSATVAPVKHTGPGTKGPTETRQLRQKYPLSRPVDRTGNLEKVTPLSSPPHISITRGSYNRFRGSLLFQSTCYVFLIL